MSTEVIPQKTEEAKESFSYASHPKPLQARRKFRNDPGAGERYGNLMFDRRIVRGNTYAQSTFPPTTQINWSNAVIDRAQLQDNPMDLQRKAEKKRAKEARLRQEKELEDSRKSPLPVDGRRHINVQTETYLEELTNRVEEADVTCQTDLFLDRPPTPKYIPAKTGVDTSTQIMPHELFDFDMEVKPILEVLVGKCVEQSLEEVFEEEELENLREQQRKFHEARKREVLATQRLEEQERRLTDERERRITQQREVRRKEKQTAEKIAARAYAQNYLMDMIPVVFGKLRDSGYFFDPIKRDIELNFMADLIKKVQGKCDESELSRLIADELIRHVVTQRLEEYE